MQSNLTIVGAGPKGVAIAAKHHVLRELGVPVPEICVLEAEEVAAHWDGSHGYTNGALPLGTAPEKDVGFPYACSGYGKLDGAVNAEMQRLSWQAFQVRVDGRSYGEWIDRGRPHPSHRQWASYLQWVGEEVELPLMQGSLREIGLEGGRWKLGLDRGEALRSDGLVITSPGPKHSRIKIEGSSRFLLDGKDFWLVERLDAIKQLAEERGSKGVAACVVGSGETAASIVLQLVQILPEDSPIEVISKDGMTYTRGESYDENRYYTDPNEWRDLNEETRRMFVKRTDRGVFSVAIKDALNRAESVRTIAGKVERIRVDEQTEELAVEFADDHLSNRYDLIVDATGFKPDWFYEAMTEDAKRALDEQIVDDGGERALPPSSWQLKEELEAKIDYNLAVAGLAPSLHLPMFAGLEQGPGFPNLSCLGLLSDRILQRYTIGGDAGGSGTGGEAAAVGS